MKKLTLTLTLITLFNATFACHLESTGTCGNKAYFQTLAFNNHSQVQIRYYTTSTTYTVIDSFITPTTGHADRVISEVIPTGDSTIKIQFRYRDTNLPEGTGWNTWTDGISDNKNWQESSTAPIPGCKTLAINHVTNLVMQWVTYETVRISFNMERSEEVGTIELIPTVDLQFFTTKPILINKADLIRLDETRYYTILKL